MPVILTTLFRFLGGSVLGRFFSDKLLMFIAQKTLLITVFTVTLPIVLKNIVNWLMESLIAATASINTDGLSSVSMTFSGLAAWFASHLLIPDCISVVLTACAIRLVLNFIPFVG